MKILDVRAHRDANAGVWWADSEDVPGLAMEAVTKEQLEDDVLAIASELLKLNLGVDGSIGINGIIDTA